MHFIYRVRWYVSTSNSCWHANGVVAIWKRYKLKSYPSRSHELTPFFSGVRVTRSLVLCVCFVDRCLSFRTLSFGHCVVCSSLIYVLITPWDLQRHIYIYMAIVMSVLQFTDSNYPFGIFKIFLIMTNVENLWCTDLFISEIIVVALFDSICSLLTFMSG